MKSFIDSIQAAPTDGGYREEQNWIWCGSVALGEDGRYHMFASRWSKRVPFNPNWLTNSMVVRAVADTPAGPYVYVEDVLPPRGASYWDGMMTHNPTIHKSGDTWLLYYTGTTYAGAMPEEGAPADAQRLEARANQRIGVATAPALAGPWTRYDACILPPRPGKWDAMMTTNPAPCVRPDGSVLLLYKAVANQQSKLCYGVAMASAWDAAYERLRDDPLAFSDDPAASYEDAYVWWQDGRYQMIFNDLSGHVTGEDHAGAHAVSADGVRWELAEPAKAYSRTIRWADGRVTTQGSFERPQLLLEDGQPAWLFAATGDGPGGFWNAKHTWNMAVPLGG